MRSRHPVTSPSQRPFIIYAYSTVALALPSRLHNSILTGILNPDEVIIPLAVSGFGLGSFQVPASLARFNVSHASHDVTLNLGHVYFQEDILTRSPLTQKLRYDISNITPHRARS